MSRLQRPMKSHFQAPCLSLRVIPTNLVCVAFQDFKIQSTGHITNLRTLKTTTIKVTPNITILFLLVARYSSFISNKWSSGCSHRIPSPEDDDHFRFNHRSHQPCNGTFSFQSIFDNFNTQITHIMCLSFVASHYSLARLLHNKCDKHLIFTWLLRLKPLEAFGALNF